MNKRINSNIPYFLAVQTALLFTGLICLFSLPHPDALDYLFYGLVNGCNVYGILIWLNTLNSYIAELKTRIGEE